MEWQRRNWGLTINIRVILTAPDCLPIDDILLFFIILSWVLVVDLELKKNYAHFHYQSNEYLEILKTYRSMVFC